MGRIESSVEELARSRWILVVVVVVVVVYITDLGSGSCSPS